MTHSALDAGETAGLIVVGVFGAIVLSVLGVVLRRFKVVRR